MKYNPCLECGACCAVYRVSFYWTEADDETSGGVPIELTEEISQFLRAMKGTNTNEPYCAALEGTVGHPVFCTIYEKRPSACREVTPFCENGLPDDKCTFARLAYNLKPLDDEKRL